jgi:hypothetical protein
MRSKVKKREKLSLSEKISRLTLRLRDPEWRRYGATLLAGKMLGIAIFFVAIVVIPAIMSHAAYAQDATTQASTQRPASQPPRQRRLTLTPPPRAVTSSTH